MFLFCFTHAYILLCSFFPNSPILKIFPTDTFPNLNPVLITDRNWRPPACRAPAPTQAEVLPTRRQRGPVRVRGTEARPFASEPAGSRAGLRSQADWLLGADLAQLAPLHEEQVLQEQELSPENDNFLKKLSWRKIEEKDNFRINQRFILFYLKLSKKEPKTTFLDDWNQNCPELTNRKPLFASHCDAKVTS